MEKTEKEYIAFFHIPKQTERRVRKSEVSKIHFTTLLEPYFTIPVDKTSNSKKA